MHRLLRRCAAAAAASSALSAPAAHRNTVSDLHVGGVSVRLTLHLFYNTVASFFFFPPLLWLAACTSMDLHSRSPMLHVMPLRTAAPHSPACVLRACCVLPTDVSARDMAAALRPPADPHSSHTYCTLLAWRTGSPAGQVPDSPGFYRRRPGV